MRDFIVGHRSFGLVTPARRSVSGAPAPTPPVISGFSTSGAPDSMAMTVDVASTVHWMLDANATRTAAQIIAGGGESSGSQAVSAGVVSIALDFSAVADGTWFLHVVADNGASSNVIVQEVTFVTGGSIVQEQVVAVTSSQKGSAFTFSGAITTGSATNRIVVAIVHGKKDVGTDTPVFSSFTLGGVAMTQQFINQSAASSSHFSYIAVFTLVNAAAGAKDLAITMAQTDDAMAVTLIELSGVDQVAPITSIDTPAIASGSGGTVNLTTTTAGAWIIGAGAWKGGDINPFTITGDASEISDGDTGTSGSSDLSYCSAAGEIATAGAVSMTMVGSRSDVYIIAGLELEPA